MKNTQHIFHRAYVHTQSVYMVTYVKFQVPNINIFLDNGITVTREHICLPADKYLEYYPH